MVDILKKNFFSKNIIQLQINFLFISFVFLSGLKYDFFQFRFLILVLLVPCGLILIKESINKNFKNFIFLFSFFFLIILHSLLNIIYENNDFSYYNLFGIFLITFIFTISLFYYENFNKNILKIIRLFLLIFFTSILLSFFDIKNDAPFFCGGIPDIFRIINSYNQTLPDGSFGSFTLGWDRTIKLSFKEYLFKENSHLGMIAPSIIIYLIYYNFTNKPNLSLKFLTISFILICIIKSSTTLLLGTILSASILLISNFRFLSKHTLIALSGLIIIFILILFSSEECRARFVPIYNFGEKTISMEESIVVKDKDIIGSVDKKFAIKLKQIMRTPGNLSSGVYYKGLYIAKQSIFEKPFGWGLNRYDKAFEYFNKKNPSNNKHLNTLNSKDGANNFVKLIVEFGIFALFIYLFVLFFIFNKKIPIELKLFYLPFIITQSIRGAGYFNSGFSLIIFLMFFTYLRYNKKII